MRNPAAQVGDHILDPLPPIDLGRIAAQSAKQVIVQRVREAERERQYNEFKDRIGEIVVGEVKRVEHGNVLVDLGRAEAIVRRDDLIPRELFRPKDRIRAFLYDVRHELRGPQIFLSRTHPGFMEKLFEQEVPEIYDGIIEIKACARDPGSRAKIAVISKDSGIDPVGACVGMRGSRVQAVVQELGGEKVDIIPWSPDPATFVVNALAPAEVSKVVLDPDAKRIEVIVPDQHAAHRDRPARPERAPRLAADRLGHRHRLRHRRSRAAPARVPRADRDVHGRAQRRGGDRPAAGHRGLHLGPGRGLHRRPRSWPASRASTRRSPRRSRSAPRPISTRSSRTCAPRPPSSAWPRICWAMTGCSWRRSSSWAARA